MNIPKLLFPLSILSILFLSSCAETGYQTQQVDGPGLHHTRAWNGEPVHYSNSEIGVTAGVDIDGKVGYPLTISGPSASCVSASGQPHANWSIDPRVTSGSLPPGITINGSSSVISGVPTERGHWIVTLSSSDLICDGTTYNGFTQEIRFHITGSGQVVQ